MEKKTNSLLTDDWESDLAAIIEKTNQNLNLLRKIGEKRDDQQPSKTSIGLLQRPRAPLVVPKSDDRTTTEASINKWKRVLDESTTMKRHITNRILDKAKKDATRAAWEPTSHLASLNSITNQDDYKEHSTKHSSTLQSMVPLDEIKKSIEVDVASRARGIEKLVADLQLDFKGLSKECAASAKKVDEYQQKIDAKLTHMDAFEMDTQKSIESIPRLENQTVLLLKWKSSIEYDMQATSSKITHLTSVQEKYAGLERQQSDLNNKFQVLPSIEGDIEVLTKRVQELERIASKQADGAALSHSLDLAVNKAVAAFEERQSKRMDDLVSMQEAKIASFVKTFHGQRENYEKSLQYALDSGLSDVHAELEQLQKRVDTRIHELNTTVESRLTGISKRMASIEVKFKSHEGEEIEKLQQTMLKTVGELFVSRSQFATLVTEEIGPTTSACRRIESMMTKNQAAQDSKWNECTIELSKTSALATKLENDFKTQVTNVQKASQVENQNLKTKLHQSFMELEHLRQVRQEMDHQVLRLENDRSTQAAKFANQIKDLELTQSEEVQRLNVKLHEKTIEAAIAAGKVQSLQDVWKRDLDQLEVTKQKMQKARLDSIEMSSKLQHASQEYSRKLFDQRQCQDQIRRLNQQLDYAKRETTQLRTILQKTQNEGQYQQRITILGEFIERIKQKPRLGKEMKSSDDVERMLIEIASLKKQVDDSKQELDRIQESKTRLEEHLRSSFEARLEMKNVNALVSIETRQRALSEATAKLEEYILRENQVDAAIQSLGHLCNLKELNGSNDVIGTLRSIQLAIVQLMSADKSKAKDLNIEHLEAELKSTMHKYLHSERELASRTRALQDELINALDEKQVVETRLIELQNLENEKRRNLEIQMNEMKIEMQARQDFLDTSQGTTEFKLQEKIKECEVLKNSLREIEETKEKDIESLLNTSKFELETERSKTESIIQQISKLETQLKHLQESNLTLSTEYEELIHKLDTTRNSLEQSELVKSDLTLTVNELSLQLDEAKSDMHRMQGDLACLDDEKRSLSMLLDSTREELNILAKHKQELSTNENEYIMKLKTEKIKLEEVKNDLEKTIEEWKEKEHRIQHQHNELLQQNMVHEVEFQHQVSLLSSQLKEEHERAAIREEQLRDIVQHLQRSSAEGIDHAQDPIFVLHQEITNLKATAASAKSDISRILHLIDTTLDGNSERYGSTTIHEAAERISALNSDRTALSEKISTLLGEIRMHEQLEESLRNDSAFQAATLKALEIAVHSAEEELEFSVQELEKTKLAWKSDLDSSSQKIVFLEEQCAHAVSREEVLAKELSQISQQCDEDTNIAQDVILNGLEQSLESLEAQCELYASDIKEAETSHDTKQAEIDSTHISIQNLHRDIAMLRGQMNMTPIILSHMNYTHNFMSMSETGHDRNINRTQYHTLQSQLVADIEISLHQLSTNGENINFISKSIKRLHEIHSKLNYVTQNLNNFHIQQEIPSIRLPREKKQQKAKKNDELCSQDFDQTPINSAKAIKLSMLPEPDDAGSHLEESVASAEGSPSKESSPRHSGKLPPMANPIGVQAETHSGSVSHSNSSTPAASPSRGEDSIAVHERPVNAASPPTLGSLGSLRGKFDSQHGLDDPEMDEVEKLMLERTQHSARQTTTAHDDDFDDDFDEGPPDRHDESVDEVLSEPGEMDESLDASRDSQQASVLSHTPPVTSMPVTSMAAGDVSRLSRLDEKIGSESSGQARGSAHGDFDTREDADELSGSHDDELPPRNEPAVAGLDSDAHQPASATRIPGSDVTSSANPHDATSPVSPSADVPPVAAPSLAYDSEDEVLSEPDDAGSHLEESVASAEGSPSKESSPRHSGKLPPMANPIGVQAETHSGSVSHSNSSTPAASPSRGEDSIAVHERPVNAASPPTLGSLGSLRGKFDSQHGLDDPEMDEVEKLMLERTQHSAVPPTKEFKSNIVVSRRGLTFDDVDVDMLVENTSLTPEDDEIDGKPVEAGHTRNDELVLLENSLDLENSFDGSDDDMLENSNVRSDIQEYALDQQIGYTRGLQHDDAFDLTSDEDDNDNYVEADAMSSPSIQKNLTLRQRLEQAKLRTVSSLSTHGATTEYMDSSVIQQSPPDAASDGSNRNVRGFGKETAELECEEEDPPGFEQGIVDSRTSVNSKPFLDGDLDYVEKLMQEHLMDTNKDLKSPNSNYHSYFDDDEVQIRSAAVGTLSESEGAGGINLLKLPGSDRMSPGNLSYNTEYETLPSLVSKIKSLDDPPNEASQSAILESKVQGNITSRETSSTTKSPFKTSPRRAKSPKKLTKEDDDEVYSDSFEFEESMGSDDE